VDDTASYAYVQFDRIEAAAPATPGVPVSG